jgi:hypothetical protein
MNNVRSGSLQLLFAILILLLTAWASGEATQWLLRNRAERLLTDVRAIHVDQSKWADVQPMMSTWAQWASSKGACTEQNCNYRINIEQTLPSFLIGNPSGGRNWLPRFANLLGLRNTAARGGFTVERGVVTAKWFGEQVTLPVEDWGVHTDYIPYLSVLSGESSMFKAEAKDHPQSHPNRTVQRANNYLVVSFTPSEEPAEKAKLMDFQFNCITQIRPCHSEYYILPEAWRMMQEQKH